MVAQGSTLTFSVKVWSAAPSEPGSVLVNPASASLVLTRDGVSIATPTITLPPAETGVLTYNYPNAVAGRYLGIWFLTMADGSTASYPQTLLVEPPDPGHILGLAQAKKHLNIPLSTVTHDEEILEWLSALTPVIEDHVGACVPRTVVEYQDGGSRVLRLRKTPVLSVTTIVPYLTAGMVYAPSQVRVTADGRLMLLNGFPFDYGPYEVTYVAGRSVLPPNVVAAVKIILGHLWETQRGAAGLPLQGGDDLTTIEGLGYAIPNRALELLEPDDTGPAIG